RDELSFVDAWHEPAPALLQFTADCREQRFPRGVGLPGRVWQGDDRAWIQDIHDDPNFPRASSAERAGLHAAFAAPIVLGGETLGVMEFLAPEIRARDEDVLSALAAVGSQIGDEGGGTITRAKLPGKRALRGRYSPEVLLKFHHRETGAERWVLAEATAIGDFEPPRMAVTVLRDITERRRAQEAQRFLAEASEILGSSLHYGRTLQQIADLAVPRLADWCLVDTMQPDGTLLPVAMGHSDPAKLELARRLRERHPADPTSPS